MKTQICEASDVAFLRLMLMQLQMNYLPKLSFSLWPFENQQTEIITGHLFERKFVPINEDRFISSRAFSSGPSTIMLVEDYLQVTVVNGTLTLSFSSNVEVEMQ